MSDDQAVAVSLIADLQRTILKQRTMINRMIEDHKAMKYRIEWFAQRTKDDPATCGWPEWGGELLDETVAEAKRMA